MAPSRCERITSRRPRQAALAILSLLAAAGVVRHGGTCGGTPPAPFCSATLVLAKAVPDVVVIPPGGAGFDTTVPVLVFLGLTGNGCPPTPAEGFPVDITLTVSCGALPGGAGTYSGGAGSGTGLPGLTPGFNVIAVTVAIEPGPPRECTVTGTASTVLTLPVGPQTSGSPPVTAPVTITATGDSVICLVDPVPGTTDVPRLDLELIGSPGSEIVRVHPGDLARFDLRLTNNDPLETFHGLIAGSSSQSSRLPAASGGDLTSAGRGVYAISDPGGADVFPIGFSSSLDLLNSLPLPADPFSVTGFQVSSTVTVPPGGTLDVPFYARPYGMCSNGSCGEMTISIHGLFSDGTEGLACAGVVTAADTGVPPQFAWPDAGRALPVFPLFPSPTGLRFTGQGYPGTGSGFQVDMTCSNFSITANGNPVNLGNGLQQFASPLGMYGGRLQKGIFNNFQTLFPSNANLAIGFDIEMAPTPGSLFTFEGYELSEAAGAPAGFDHIGPFGMATTGIHLGGPPQIDSFFDIFYQVSLSAVERNNATQTETRIPVHISDFTMTPLPVQLNRVGFHIEFNAVPQASGGPDPVVYLEVYGDARGYERPYVEIEEPGGIDLFVEALLGLGQPPLPSFRAYDHNGDGTLNSADLVHYINAIP